MRGVLESCGPGQRPVGQRRIVFQPAASWCRLLCSHFTDLRGAYMTSGKIETQSTATEVQRTGRNSLTVTDNRTGKTYELPITDDTIRALDLRQIKVNSEDFGMMSYDPAFNNTA